MGFDLHGVKPKTEIGSYFRNNCWYWRPLWDYVCSECKDFIDEDTWKRGHFNDGLLIDEEKAVKMAERLDKAIKDGKVAQAKQSYQESARHEQAGPEAILSKMLGVPEDQSLYPFEIINVKEFAEFCKTSGGFEIW